MQYLHKLNNYIPNVGKGVPFRLGNGKSVILYVLLKNLTSIDLSRTCYRHVPIILDVSIEVSQFKEYRIGIVSRCLVPGCYYHPKYF